MAHGPLIINATSAIDFLRGDTQGFPHSEEN
jgi:hypothetical protein